MIINYIRLYHTSWLYQIISDSIQYHNDYDINYDHRRIYHDSWKKSVLSTTKTLKQMYWRKKCPEPKSQYADAKTVLFHGITGLWVHLILWEPEHEGVYVYRYECGGCNTNAMNWSVHGQSLKVRRTFQPQKSGDHWITGRWKGHCCCIATSLSCLHQSCNSRFVLSIDEDPKMILSTKSIQINCKVV